MHPRFLYDLNDCAILSAIETVGDSWTLKILREAVYGLRRFDDFARALGCGRGVLSDRLKKLTAAGVLERKAYAEPGQRPRAEYHLTDMGWDAVPALLALGEWRQRWAPAKEGPVIRVTEPKSGRPARVVLTADPKTAALSMEEVRISLGPGARRMG
ncbi:MAG TPA: helix-turn-helix domain-containing protein [Phenylobacterium sp.]|jgi:DNA-binding HxlR family transcriptional regulator|nr:helix-turn-helix domain-containing protein [Phenylobacterium sp.]